MSRPIVAFDYDGTLIDSYEIKRQSYWLAVSETLRLTAVQRPIVDASYARTSGAHRLQQLADTARALKITVSPAQEQEFSRLYSAYNDAAKDLMQEFPSVRSVLQALQARFDLALISGLPDDLLTSDARERGLGEFFMRIEGGDKGRALDHLRAEGRKVILFVGDTPHDEGVAEEKGVRFFQVRGDDDLRGIPGLLKRAGKGGK
jgi:phosphoglycolate phosphatase-like HAD superfamily hydrolase